VPIATQSYVGTAGCALTLQAENTDAASLPHTAVVSLRNQTTFVVLLQEIHNFSFEIDVSSKIILILM
jgi:hypothetical protein